MPSLEKFDSSVNITDVNDDDAPKGFVNKLRKFKLGGLARECLAEFYGTMILIIIGDGVVAQTVLSNNGAGSALSIHICWGLAVLFGVLASAGVSGAHLNPAVSLTLSIFGRFEWKKLGPYIAAQMAGAFMGAAMVYGFYIDSFNAYDGGVRSAVGETATAGIFATYPQPYMSIPNALWCELWGTAMLLGGIFAIGDSQNANLPAGFGPFAVAALVMAIGMSMGFPTGYAINPARDLGPRLFTLVAGFGTETFTAHSFYFFVPIVGPFLGGPIGGLIYTLFIEMHHPKQE